MVWLPILLAAWLLASLVVVALAQAAGAGDRQTRRHRPTADPACDARHHRARTARRARVLSEHHG